MSEPSVQAEVTPTTAKVGDLINLHIRVRHTSDYQVDEPVFKKSLGTYEVRWSSRQPTANEGEEWIEQYRAELQNFTTGPQLLPGLVLGYKDLRGKSFQLKTPDLSVTIEEIPPRPDDKGDIRGIKGVVGPVAWAPEWWFVLIGGALAVAFYLWYKRKRALQGPPPPPPVPPDIAALKKLQTLKESGWLEAGQTKEYYSAISEILRAYLEDGFQIPALERTTNELVRSIQKNTAFQSMRQVELKDLLEECDLVKFAKWRPDPAEGAKAHALAIQIVEQSRGLLSKEDKKS